MSELVGIVAFAVLFALYCALPPRHRRCGACGGEDGVGDTCAGCPHADLRSELEEAEAKW